MNLKMDYLEELLRCFESDLIDSSFESIKMMLDKKSASGLDNLNDRLGSIEDKLDHIRWQIGSIKQVVNFTKETVCDDKI